MGEKGGKWFRKGAPTGAAMLVPSSASSSSYATACLRVKLPVEAGFFFVCRGNNMFWILFFPPHPMHVRWWKTNSELVSHAALTGNYFPFYLVYEVNSENAWKAAVTSPAFTETGWLMISLQRSLLIFLSFFIQQLFLFRVNWEEWTKIKQNKSFIDPYVAHLSICQPLSQSHQMLQCCIMMK